jgi:hypothetical protein
MDSDEQEPMSLTPIGSEVVFFFSTAILPVQ